MELITFGRLRELARKHGARSLRLVCSCAEYSADPADYWWAADTDSLGHVVTCDECGEPFEIARIIPARLEIVS